MGASCLVQDVWIGVSPRNAARLHIGWHRGHSFGFVPHNRMETL